MVVKLPDLALYPNTDREAPSFLNLRLYLGIFLTMIKVLPQMPKSNFYGGICEYYFCFSLLSLIAGAFFKNDSVSDFLKRFIPCCKKKVINSAL
ncbi:MAG: hypothetical protein IT236_14180 [Bacteroidia bacterium]|nr:hypothetical protein [Bacteroidia bacterium]